MARILLKNLSKTWGTFVAVDNQTLEIADKEFLVLLGPSGCGKTTTMRMIAGLEEPTEGEVWIGDKIVNEDLPKDRDVAMVFQNYGLYPHMSVYQNIAYPLKVRKNIPASKMDELVNKAANRVELGDFLHRRPRELSGGQRQRVALARAIVREPQVFLMDEPLSNLDAKLRVLMRAELKHLSHELKITTVYVTHDQIEAMTLADRIGVMNHGKIVQLGTPDEIYHDPATIFVADFIGSPSMNLIDGEIEEGWFVTTGDLDPDNSSQLQAGKKIVTTSYPSQKNTILGIRAEDIAITEPAQGSIQGTVFATENTGESIMVTVSIGKQRITCRGNRDNQPAITQPVGLQFVPEKTYLFDRQTGMRLQNNQ